jgi:copper homeostasis protein
MPILEVIACSVADAIEAARGGANRLEIVRAMDAGGLTPPVSLVREILAAVSIPVRVMLRENAGFQSGGEAEVEELRRAARQFAALGVDGFVIGFVRGRKLDLAPVLQILSSASGVKATFHRAFEELEDAGAAVATLKTAPPFDRILVSPARIHGLQQLVESAAPELTIIAGGGVDADAIRALRKTTSIREFHVGRAVRQGGDIGQPVDAQRVRELATLVAS